MFDAPGESATIWALHLAAAFNRPQQFEAAQDYINRSGGANLSWVLTPPGLFELSGDEEWPGEIARDAAEVPDLPIFRAQVGRVVQDAALDDSPVNVAIRFLADETFGPEPLLELVAALNGPATRW